MANPSASFQSDTIDSQIPASSTPKPPPPQNSSSLLSMLLELLGTLEGWGSYEVEDSWPVMSFSNLISQLIPAAVIPRDWNSSIPTHAFSAFASLQSSPPPRGWKHCEDPAVTFDDDDLVATVSRANMPHLKDTPVILKASSPYSKDSPLFYFECKVSSTSTNEIYLNVFLGLEELLADGTTHMFQFSSTNGKVFKNGSSAIYSSSYGSGDTVGCGYIPYLEIIFFTVNGRYLVCLLVSRSP